MVKILFVCLGNICRSPMAELVFKSLLNKNNIEMFVDSAATSSEEIGNNIYYKTVEKLQEKNIEIIPHKARRIAKEDYERFDYIIGMESKNVDNILKIIGHDKDNKIYRLLDFSENPRDISDPWYTRDFEKAYSDILEGCESLLEKLKREGIK